MFVLELQHRLECSALSKCHVYSGVEGPGLESRCSVAEDKGLRTLSVPLTYIFGVDLKRQRLKCQDLTALLRASL